MFKRNVTVGVTGALAIGASFLPAAAAAPNTAHRFAVDETQNIAQVATTGKPGTTSLRLISAGAIHGTIGKQPILGALRASGEITSPTTSIVHGTEFDAGGSRLFVLHIQFTIANGRVTDHGSGRWARGTGSYAHAHGSFTIAGSRPVNGASSIHLHGTITF